MRRDSEIPVGVGGPSLPSDALLSLADWDALPVATRVSDRLADVLLALDDIQADLPLVEATDLRWLAPHIGAASSTIHQLLQRLAC
jgi:hypothetical protein